MRDRYAVIGNPVAHSKSPWIHAEFARATGQAIEYVAIEAPRDGFARTVAAFRAAGGRGANVTLPFKEEAFALCTARSARACAARAVNTLRFDGETEIFGDNTDGVGLVTDLEKNLGFAIAGKRVLLAGAGGAAQGVAGPLVAAGAALAIANRSAERARALAERFPPARGGGYDAFAGERFDLVVNATSAGLSGEMPPLPEGVFAPQVLAYEMVYGRDTPFLAAARAAGARTADGLGMLVEQAAEAFLVWRGVRPPTAAVLAALRAG
ncbi:MAG: shikimate dehydrogenase [Burkholderiales bacterium]|nr:shikimate dehydrogenase [Burkholderiales bacterium]